MRVGSDARDGPLLHDRALWCILAFALLIRVGVALWPVIHHADEVWQYLEPASHLGVGPWVMTWEARAGARSWLLPTLFAGPVALGHALAPGSGVSIVLARLICVLLSFGTILGAAVLGARLSRGHALILALVATSWFEIAYFASRTLSEPIATACFIAAAACLVPGRNPRWTIVGGALLGACCVVRFQYAPAAAVLALAVALSQGRRLGWLVLGGSVALALGALADLAAGAWPLLWVVRNVTLNLVDNRSAAFGIDPPWRYFHDLFGMWGWAIVPIVALALAGARRYPALFVAALVDLAVHMLVPHKEYRFILLTTTVLVLLAAIGSVDLVQRLTTHRWRYAALGAAWVALSIGCGATGDSVRTWGQNGELIAAWRLAGAQPQVCGIAMYRPREVIVASQALFDRTAPIYQYDSLQYRAAQRSQAFNLVMTSRDRGSELPRYRLVGCPRDDRREFCVYARPGGCAATRADAPFAINAVLRRQGI